MSACAGKREASVVKRSDGRWLLREPCVVKSFSAEALPYNSAARELSNAKQDAPARRTSTDNSLSS